MNQLRNNRRPDAERGTAASRRSLPLHRRYSGSIAVAAAVAAAIWSPTAVAQQTGQAADPVEQIVVTGSRIPRPDIVSNSPVNVLDSSDFELSGSVEVERLLDTLPQVVGTFGASSNNPGTGTATVNLRGLGAERTLVLINGRRMVAASTDGVVDLNSIPPALIERVEVVTGGASAIYGSDALAGVVNLITRRPGGREAAEVEARFPPAERRRWKAAAEAGEGVDGSRERPEVGLDFAFSSR